MKRALAPFVVCLFTVLTAFGLNARFREKLTASDGTTNDAFGSAVDVDGDWAVMGAPKTSGDTNGVAYFFQWNGTNWVQQDRVTPSDSAQYDQFGEAVAICGDSAIIGASHPMIFSAGKAYVFTRSGTTWTEQDDMTEGEDSTIFGESVDISGDYAIVGDRLGTNGAGVATGAAYVYKRTAGTWGLEVALAPSDGVADDWFGHDVAIDDDYAIVGASGRSNMIGGAYIFKRDGVTWTEVALLNNPDDTLGDFFGRAVDIDDGWALVGTRHDSCQGAYLYRLDGSNWVAHTDLPDIYGRGDFYGQDVALADPYAVVGGGEHAILWKRDETNWIKQVYMGGSGDNWDLAGTRMAVHWRNVLTGHEGDDTLGDAAGAAWMLPVHDRNRQSELIPTNMGLHYIGSGVAVDGDRALVGARGGNVAQDFGYCGVFGRTDQYWLAQAELVPNDPESGMEFGSATALAGDYAVVGAEDATNAVGENPGAAYVFWCNGANWTQQAKLTDSDDEDGQQFGSSVATDGRWALVGAPNYDSADGKVVMYRRDGASWIEGITVPDPVSDTGQFGWDLGFDGTRAIIGSPNEFEGGQNAAGAAYVYRLDDTNWIYEARLAAGTPSFFMRLGEAVDLDDDWAVCGAPNENAPVDQCGAIYLYRRSGTAWSQVHRVSAPEPFTNGYFGSSVAIRKPYLLACADGTEAHRAYVFKQDGTNWNLLTRFYPGDSDPSEAFGDTCDLSDDHAVIGVNVEYGHKAYLFWREAWDQQPEIKGLCLTNGSLRLDACDLLIGATCRVERASGLDPIEWDVIHDDKPFKPESNWVVNPVVPDRLGVVRVLCIQPGPDAE